MLKACLLLKKYTKVVGLLIVLALMAIAILVYPANFPARYPARLLVQEGDWRAKQLRLVMINRNGTRRAVSWEKTIASSNAKYDTLTMVEQPGAGIAWVPNGFEGLYREKNGPEMVRVINSSSWSPDEKNVAFIVMEHLHSSRHEDAPSDAKAYEEYIDNFHYRLEVLERKSGRIKELYVSRYQDPIESVQWSPNGRYIALGIRRPHNEIIIFEAATGRQIKFNAQGFVMLAWSPDGTAILCMDFNRYVTRKDGRMVGGAYSVIYVPSGEVVPLPDSACERPDPAIDRYGMLAKLGKPPAWLPE